MRTRTRAVRGARPPRPTHATAMTPENLMNTSIDTMAMQHATTADRAPPHAGIDPAATPMAASGLDKRYDGQPALDPLSRARVPGPVLGLHDRNRSANRRFGNEGCHERRSRVAPVAKTKKKKTD